MDAAAVHGLKVRARARRCVPAGGACARGAGGVSCFAAEPRGRDIISESGDVAAVPLVTAARGPRGACPGRILWEVECRSRGGERGP